MKKHSALLVGAAIAALMGLPALAQPPAGGAAPGRGGGGAGISQSDTDKLATLPGMPDIKGKGPYPALYEAVVGAGQPYVVYRPADLAAATKKRKLGVYVWGNGGCGGDGAIARFHLTEIASHGYLVVDTGKILTGPKAPPAAPGEQAGRGGGGGGDGATAEKMIAGLDWILAENARKGSPYYNRMDPSKVAISGNSCGGLIAMRASMDPRAKSLVLQNSGTFGGGAPGGAAAAPGGGRGGGAAPGGGAPGGAAPGGGAAPAGGRGGGGGGGMSSMTKADLVKIRLPMLYILGGPTDVAQPNGMDDFSKIEHVPVFVADHPGAGHFGVFLEPYSVGTQVELDWMAWRLYGDKQAAKTFVGKNCRLCTDPQWKVSKKKID